MRQRDHVAGGAEILEGTKVLTAPGDHRLAPYHLPERGLQADPVLRAHGRFQPGLLLLVLG